MIYTSLEQLAKRVFDQANSSKKTVAVIAADDDHTIEAVTHAAENGIADPVLIGDRAGIRQKLFSHGKDPDAYSVIHAGSNEECSLLAARLLLEGKADFLMKGHIPTNTMLKQLFSKEAGFRTGKIISHLSVAEVPSYHKLIAITDAAINLNPNLEEKRFMIENAVQTMLRMGFDCPKVAVLASTEVANEKMPETMDASLLKEMNAQGVIRDCVIDGPLSFDLAVSRKSVQIKGMTSPVGGDADLLVTPNIAAGNILLKTLRYSAGASTAGIVIGGRAPVVLTSRSVEPMDKYWPLILAASACSA